MTSRAGKALSNQSGFADWIEARAARQGRRDSGFADWIEARAARQGRRDSGFTYTVVLIMLIALGLAAGTATQVGSQRVQAEREAELLFRGQAYRHAIKSYYESAAETVPPSARALPRTLDDLLKDPRFQHRRHLRALYPDPLAPRAEGSDGWRVLRAEDGGILGIASHSRAEPLRRANFPAGLEGLAGARTHADWQFVFTPPAPTLTLPAPGGKPQPPAAAAKK